LRFEEYEERALQTDQTPTGDNALVIPLLGLVGEAAGLLSEYKKALRDRDLTMSSRTSVRDELGDVLWYLTNVAHKVGVTLDDVAQANLDKITDRWPSVDDAAPKTLFDQAYPPGEQIPRRFIAELTGDMDSDGRGTSVLTINGVQIGNVLRDNAYEDDGYRYHDIAHVGFAAMLGWSPVIRGFLHRKRKSNPRVDEVEDGGRAQVIEEGVAAVMFAYAARNNYLANATGVDTDLLETMRRITRGLEVSGRSLLDWERTILRIYEIWRSIREVGSGAVAVDLERGTMELLGPMSSRGSSAGS
jgi:NTP pyrophosphatase (non-canonical NTP hydrolase)